MPFSPELQLQEDYGFRLGATRSVPEQPHRHVEQPSKGCTSEPAEEPDHADGHKEERVLVTGELGAEAPNDELGRERERVQEGEIHTLR